MYKYMIGCENMKKKGFTLIEMLVVITLLAIIMLIAISSVIRLKASHSKEEYDTHVKLMRQALDAYTIKYQSKLKTYNEESECMILNYEKLVDTDILKEKGVKCTGKVVLTPKTSGTYDYEYFLKCHNENNPEIVLSDYEESELEKEKKYLEKIEKKKEKKCKKNTVR